jgi:hypothetical protein
VSQSGRLNLPENPFQRKPENPVRETAFLDRKNTGWQDCIRGGRQDQPGKMQLLKLWRRN